jgi:hypothetical protein
LNSVATGASADPLEAARAWLARAAELPDTALHSWTSRIGGVPIHFRCTAPELAQLYRARLVGHCPEPREPPVLQLDLLETERLGWMPPDLAAERRSEPSDLARRFAQARLGALTPPLTGDGRYPWVFFESSSGRGVMLVRTAADLPSWAAGAPFALLLHLAFAWRGWRLLHAGALGSGTAGALLVGPGGSGKSGTTVAGIAHGLLTAGDDYLLVEPGSPPVVWPVYRVLKQDPAGLSRAGRDDLADRAVNWSGKVELDVDAEFPSRLTDRLALKLILLPSVTGARRTEVLPAAPTEAFSAVAGSMLTQLPGARIAGFSFLTRLTRALPAYHLRLSADPQEIAATIHQLLEP